MGRFATTLAALLIAGAPLFGCIGQHRPKTEIKYGLGGFRFTDTKDNDVSWDELVIDPSTRVAKVTGFQLRNNASDPINAFVSQMQVQVELHKQLGENMNMIFSQLNSMIETIAPLVPIAGPAVDVEEGKEAQ